LERSKIYFPNRLPSKPSKALEKKTERQTSEEVKGLIVDQSHIPLAGIVFECLDYLVKKAATYIYAKLMSGCVPLTNLYRTGDICRPAASSELGFRFW
jgi:hypothetical protein